MTDSEEDSDGGGGDGDGGDGDDDNVLHHRLVALGIVLCQGHSSSKQLLSQEMALNVLQRYLRFRDGRGRVPLHSALRWNSSVQVIQFLLAGWPESVKTRTTTSSRKLPLHYVSFDRGGESSLRLVQLLVQAWPDAVRQPDARGWLPLHYACCYAAGASSDEIIAFLLECWPKSIRVKTSRDEELPLHLACRNKNIPSTTIQRLVQSWPEAVQEIDEGGRLPLHRACHCQASPDVIQYLVECWPASLQVCDEYDRMPLHWACKFHSSATMIQYLLNAYPPAVQVRDASSYFPLHYACCTRRRKNHNKLLPLEIIEHLVRLWPDSVRAKGGEQDHLPLHAALSDEHEPYCNGNDQMFVEMIQFLVQCWPESLQVRDREGNLPLHLACCCARIERERNKSSFEIITEYLVQAWPDSVYQTNKNGWLPLHMACGGGGGGGDNNNNQLERPAPPSLEVIQLLVNCWPESLHVSTTNDEGQLPLHLACMHHPSPAVILYLLNSYPPAARIPDDNGKLPLHHACARKSRRTTRDALPITVMEHLVQAWPESCLVACPYTHEYEKF